MRTRSSPTSCLAMAFGRLMHEHNTTPSVRFLLQKCRKCLEMCTFDRNSFLVTSDELNFEDVYKIHLVHLDPQILEPNHHTFP